MALFGKDERSMRPEDARPVITNAPIAEPRGGEPTEVQAHLGRGSRIEGKLHFEGSVRIDGEVEGEVEAQDSVIIGETATVVAQVNAATLIIKGKVTGDVTASKRVELRAPARLLGNIVTPSLIIQDGVVFEGHCSMAAADDRAERDRDRRVAIFPTEERASARAAEAAS